MESRVTLRVAASVSGVRSAASALAEFTAWHEVASGQTWKLQVALDEVLSNVLHHGLSGGDEGRQIEIEFGFGNGVFEVKVVDDAPPFDPLAAEAPELGLPAEERPIGGLGIALVRRLMDEVTYERQGHRNCLKLRKILAP